MIPIIRSATPGELERLPAVLPRWRLLPGDECFVAEADSPRRLVGAGMFGARTLSDGFQVAQVDLALMPRFLNRQVMIDLLQPLQSRAAELNFQELHLIGPRLRPSLELTLLEELGFTERHTNIIYEFSCALLHEKAARIHALLTKRNTIPDEVEVTGLRMADWPAAVNLLRSENLLEPREQIMAEQVGIHRYYNSSSCLLYVKGRVAGVALGKNHGRILETCARIVAPDLRGGRSWANALLVYHGTSISLKLGLEIIRMKANPQRHLETMKLAETMNAIERGREVFLARPTDTHQPSQL